MNKIALLGNYFRIGAYTYDYNVFIRDDSNALRWRCARNRYALAMATGVAPLDLPYHLNLGAYRFALDATLTRITLGDKWIR